MRWAFSYGHNLLQNEKLYFNEKGKTVSSVLKQYEFFSFFFLDIQFSSVQSLSHVWLFATPWIAACQASLSITNSRSLLKLMSIELVIPSSHLILCRPFSSCPQSLPASGSFQWVNSSHEVAKVLEFQLQHHHTLYFVLLDNVYHIFYKIEYIIIY